MNHRTSESLVTLTRAALTVLQNPVSYISFRKKHPEIPGIAELTGQTIDTFARSLDHAFSPPVRPEEFTPTDTYLGIPYCRK